MVQAKRLRPKAFKEIIANLDGLDGKVGRAGWFESSVYEDGNPVAYIAAIQEHGAVIDHPGGTPYKHTPDGVRFVSKAEGAGLPVTKPHKIVIPPRPFMRPTADQQGSAWLKLLGEGSKAVLRGKRKAIEVMELVALKAAGDIAKTISQLTSPPLAKGTIAGRRRKMANKSLVGGLDKPLVASGILLNSVTGKAEDA